MSTKGSTGIFRPWDSSEPKKEEAHIKEDKEVSVIDWRVPPVEWNEALEQYWSYVATTGGIMFKQCPPKIKQRPKKFRCPHCDVAFSNNGQLKGHVRIHTGERPFRCEEEGCGKSFTRNEELTRHKRIHSGVRPYSCTQCGKTFGRKDHLKKHARTHLPHYAEFPPQFFVYPYIYGY